jgi:uncharacterized phage protein (TIGR02216 family)
MRQAGLRAFGPALSIGSSICDSAMTPTPRPFPWRRAMAVGFGRLGLSSAQFWALTPRELAAAIEGVYGATATPMDRGMLDRMMSRFPDGSGEDRPVLDSRGGQ